MAHHKLIVIGRLAQDPKVRDFDNGGRVAKFGLPIEFMRAKYNPQTGQWEGGSSFFIDVDVFNRETRKLADLVMERLRKGSMVYVEGRLKPNEYTDKNGVKTFRPVLVADTIEFLDGRPEGAGGMGADEGMRGVAAPRTGMAAAPRKPASLSEDYPDEPEPASEPARSGPAKGRSETANEDDIPF
jgi:single-strand DNA-binding protein